jgi:hypothetical protein
MAKHVREVAQAPYFDTRSHAPERVHKPRRAKWRISIANFCAGKSLPVRLYWNILIFRNTIPSRNFSGRRAEIEHSLQTVFLSMIACIAA